MASVLWSSCFTGVFMVEPPGAIDEDCDRCLPEEAAKAAIPVRREFYSYALKK
jgi:hypothetical protein